MINLRLGSSCRERKTDRQNGLLEGLRLSGQETDAELKAEVNSHVPRHH